MSKFKKEDIPVGENIIGIDFTGEETPFEVELPKIDLPYILHNGERIDEVGVQNMEKTFTLCDSLSLSLSKTANRESSCDSHRIGHGYAELSRGIIRPNITYEVCPATICFQLREEKLFIDKDTLLKGKD
jgi:hypothetical protein